MKKTFLATTAMTAIALAGVASAPANAQESSMMSAAGNTLNIGGYYEFGFASLSDDLDLDDDGANAYTYGESELFIDFETASDGGLTYGVQIDLELVNSESHAESGPAANAEEASIYISGDFGTVHLGHDDNAYGRFQTWAPTYEGATSQDDNVLYSGLTRIARIPNPMAGQNNIPADATSDIQVLVGRSAAGQGAAYEDNAKLTYVSPNFDGFQIGVSSADPDNSVTSPTSFGASWQVDTSSFLDSSSLTLTGSAYSNNANEDKETHRQIGATIELRNWTFTVARYDGEVVIDLEDLEGVPIGNLTLPAGTGKVAFDLETIEYGAGIRLTDRLGFGASIATAETTSSEIAGFGRFFEEGDFQTLSGSYTFLPGLKTTLSYNRFDVGVGDSNLANNGTEIVSQIEFSF